MAKSSSDLDRFPTADCEMLANWVMKNFAFGPRVLLRKVGAWEHENRERDGHIVLTVKTDYRDRMHDRWDKGVFRIMLDRTGFPVYAEAVTRFGDEDVRRLATQTDFRVLSNLTSFRQLEAIHAPFTEIVDTMELFADWAFENIELNDLHVAVPEGDWKIVREHGSVLFSRDATFRMIAENDPKGLFSKKGTFFVAFDPEGTPVGAWARADSRPFALRERAHFPDVGSLGDDAHPGTGPRTPSP